jgi:hypothetical protein
MLHRDLDVFFIDKGNRPTWIGAVASIPEALMVIRNQAKQTPGKFLLHSHNLNSKSCLEVNKQGEISFKPTRAN